MIELENRYEAYTSVPKELRNVQILEILGNREMTAKEIAVEMNRKGMIPTSERNFTAPRLSEMLDEGIVEVIGKKKCAYTGKNVSVFRKRKRDLWSM